ncbi:B12-binding domain-containing radical SAM protein [Magnetofaba australis]|uniref:Putative radical SAM domain-containing protein n=1 Tax=Magnetofaba australis IT-1 TaxID=1434232 RepID=A0A1Y2K093_9PROT|nr:radical SAM protein [Magnetofaba australis]OSM01463.1 putative radical SAM domain-containing protein [Magnetofaba australis IT-1]
MAEIILIQTISGDWDEMSMRIPESLLAVASVPAARGYDVRIIDQRLSADFEQELDHAIGPETKLVGLTVITGRQILHALNVSKHIKERYPQLPVCWGGVHPTLLPEQTAEHPAIDYVVVGDGEFVFCELFEHLRDGRSPHDLRGLVYKVKGALQPISNAGQLEIKQTRSGQSYTFTRRNGSSDIIRDLDSLPPLPYHLIDVQRYEVLYTGDGRKSATLNTSRGCPYRCKFCSDPAINLGKWRGYSPKAVLDKVDYLYREHNVRMIAFQDDYFPGSKKRFVEILQGLSQYKRDVQWATIGLRSDILYKLEDHEYQLLLDAGCYGLDMGVESGNPRVFESLNKGETLEQVVEVNRRLAQVDIKVKYSFIIGFPGESEEEMMDSVRMALQLERENPNAYTIFFTFLPIVGTPQYQDAVAQGFHEPQSLEEWAYMDFDGWMNLYRNWTSPELRSRLEAISFVSYFHSPHVIYKFGGSKLLRFAFTLYHPIAKWRFEKQYFDYCFEIKLKNLVLASKRLVMKLLPR